MHFFVHCCEVFKSHFTDFCLQADNIKSNDVYCLCYTHIYPYGSMQTVQQIPFRHCMFSIFVLACSCDSFYLNLSSLCAVYLLHRASFLCVRSTHIFTKSEIGWQPHKTLEIPECLESLLDGVFAWQSINTRSHCYRCLYVLAYENTWKRAFKHSAKSKYKQLFSLRSVYFNSDPI